MTLIKICGLTSMEDAVVISQFSVDIIGLVFAESRRQVSPQQAAQITSQVRKLSRQPEIAGVFVNESPHVVNRTADRYGLDMVQLSGDESWDYCRKINRPVIQVIHVLPTTSTGEIIEHINQGNGAGSKLPFVCMLDSKGSGEYGGTGHVFEWKIAQEVAAAFPVMIAGGLSAGNVGELISQVRPVGVDISSGVETDGRKDIAKVRDFIQAVRSSDGQDKDSRNLLETYSLKGGKNVTR